MNDDIKDTILSVFEASLEAQLRAIRRLRQGQTEQAQPRPKKGRSQVDMAYDILKKARTPLHVSEMIDRIQTQFGVAVDRESLVSSLSKKVARQDRFAGVEDRRNYPQDAAQTFVQPDSLLLCKADSRICDNSFPPSWLLAPHLLQNMTTEYTPSVGALLGGDDDEDDDRLFSWSCRS